MDLGKREPADGNAAVQVEHGRKLAGRLIVTLLLKHLRLGPHLARPRSCSANRHAQPMTSAACCACAHVCVAMTCMRNRQAPTETAGYSIKFANTPRSKHRAAVIRPTPSGPKSTGTSGPGLPRHSNSGTGERFAQNLDYTTKVLPQHVAFGTPDDLKCRQDRRALGRREGIRKRVRWCVRAASTRGSRQTMWTRTRRSTRIPWRSCR